MENSIGPIADPKPLTCHALYSTLCAALQLLYTDLLKVSSWHALVTDLPSSNYASMPRSDKNQIDDIGDEPNPLPNQQSGCNVRESSSSSNSSNPRDHGHRSSIMLLPGTWKYILRIQISALLSTF